MFPDNRTARGNPETTRCGIAHHLVQCLATAPMLQVTFQNVKLPQTLIRIMDPELGLFRVATLNTLLALSRDSCSFDASLCVQQISC